MKSLYSVKYPGIFAVNVIYRLKTLKGIRDVVAGSLNIYVFRFHIYTNSFLNLRKFCTVMVWLTPIFKIRAIKTVSVYILN